MAHLPRHVYVESVQSVTLETVRSVVGGVFLYAALEVLSLVLLVVVTRQKLHLSALHVIAFVLESQMATIQSKLIIFAIVAFAFPLRHFGRHDFFFFFVAVCQCPYPFVMFRQVWTSRFNSSGCTRSSRAQRSAFASARLLEACDAWKHGGSPTTATWA